MTRIIIIGGSSIGGLWLIAFIIILLDNASVQGFFKTVFDFLEITVDYFPEILIVTLALIICLVLFFKFEKITAILLFIGCVYCCINYKQYQIDSFNKKYGYTESVCVKKEKKNPFYHSFIVETESGKTIRRRCSSAVSVLYQNETYYFYVPEDTIKISAIYYQQNRKSPYFEQDEYKISSASNLKKRLKRDDSKSTMEKVYLYPNNSVFKGFGIKIKNPLFIYQKGNKFETAS